MIKRFAEEEAGKEALGEERLSINGLRGTKKTSIYNQKKKYSNIKNYNK